MVQIGVKTRVKLGLKLMLGLSLELGFKGLVHK